MTTAWTFAELWNESVISSNREQKARDYMWASEIGGPFIDRYLKMTGVQPTNPPNMRSLRKFEAGNIFEWIVRFVLQRAGLIQETQQEIWVEYQGLCRVKGKLDFLAGGVPDFDKARDDVSALKLPDSITQSSLYVVEKLREKFGDKPLKTIVLEIKSCSTFVMDRQEITGRGFKTHECQTFHYVKGLNLDEGHLVYICKDDMRMNEFGIFCPSKTEIEYVTDVKKMTEIIDSKQMPAPERKILWSPEEGKFKKNLGIEYSPYLTMIYGYELPRQYSDEVSPHVERWNRVLKRYANGDTITKANAEVKAEITRNGYDVDELVYTIQNLGVTEEETFNQ